METKNIEEDDGEEILQKYNNLLKVRDTIERMSKFNQVEILRILTNNETTTINENKYGIHINLTELNPKIINELQIYIDYVKTQELQLNQNEQQKETFKNIYFVKDV